MVVEAVTEKFEINSQALLRLFSIICPLLSVFCKLEFKN